MTTPLEGILPEKKEHTIDCYNRNKLTRCDCNSLGFNQAISECHAALNKAIKDGVIVWMPSEEKVNQLVSSDSFVFVSGNIRAKSIRELMVKGK